MKTKPKSRSTQLVTIVGEIRQWPPDRTSAIASCTRSLNGGALWGTILVSPPEDNNATVPQFVPSAAFLLAPPRVAPVLWL